MNVIGPLAGLDYGTTRIGIALSDHAGRLASPAAVLDASGRPAEDARRVAKWATGREVLGFVVGLPLNMDGTEGPQARLSRAFATALNSVTALPVELWDERLSTFAADQRLSERPLGRTARRRRRDAVAAQIILQSYLDARRGG